MSQRLQSKALDNSGLSNRRCISNTRLYPMRIEQTAMGSREKDCAAICRNHLHLTTWKASLHAGQARSLSAHVVS